MKRDEPQPLERLDPADLEFVEFRRWFQHAVATRRAIWFPDRFGNGLLWRQPGRRPTDDDSRR